MKSTNKSIVMCTHIIKTNTYLNFTKIVSQYFTDSYKNSFPNFNIHHHIHMYIYLVFSRLFHSPYKQVLFAFVSFSPCKQTTLKFLKLYIIYPTILIFLLNTQLFSYAKFSYKSSKQNSHVVQSTKHKQFLSPVWNQFSKKQFFTFIFF